LWRRPRPKLGCGAKERGKKKEERRTVSSLHMLCLKFVYRYFQKTES
jgi:hypothetical protein